MFSSLRDWKLHLPVEGEPLCPFLTMSQRHCTLTGQSIVVSYLLSSTSLLLCSLYDTRACPQLCYLYPSGKHTWEGPPSALPVATFPSVWAVRWSSQWARGRAGGLIQVFPLGLHSTSDYQTYFKSMGDLTSYY